MNVIIVIESSFCQKPLLYSFDREGRSQDRRNERATYNYIDPYAPDPYLGRALAAYRHRGAVLPPYAPGYNPYGKFWYFKCHNGILRKYFEFHFTRSLYFFNCYALQKTTLNIYTRKKQRNHLSTETPTKLMMLMMQLEHKTLIWR